MALGVPGSAEKFNHGGHGEHGVESEVWQQVEVGVFSYQLAIYSVPSVSSVVNSAGFPPRWPVRPCFEPFRHIFYFFAMRFMDSPL